MSMQKYNNFFLRKKCNSTLNTQMQKNDFLLLLECRFLKTNLVFASYMNDCHMIIIFF